MIVYTSRINYQGPGKLDISIKSGDKVFAPSWDIVMGVKNGSVSMPQYVDRYHDLMKKSYLSNTSRWMELLQMDVLVLCCYCRAGEFCHRHLLADMIIKTARFFGIECTYGGEI